MKKGINKMIITIIIIILLFIVDIVFTIIRTLFAVKDNNKIVCRGIFYDTYNCKEYLASQIKLKGTKFTCSVLNIYNEKNPFIKKRKYKIMN